MIVICTEKQKIILKILYQNAELIEGTEIETQLFSFGMQSKF